MMGVKYCVMRNLFSCPKDMQESVHVTLRSMMSQVKCRDMECDLCQAKQCISDLKMAVMDKKATCM